MTVRVIQEHLVPARNSPASVVRVADIQLIAAAHESLDVIGAEAKVTMAHRVDEFLHLETGFQVSLRPMKLDVTIGQKVNFAGVGPVLALSADDGVLGIGDRTQAEQGLVEIGQPGQVIGANVHVVKLEIHCAFHCLGHETSLLGVSGKHVSSFNSNRFRALPSTIYIFTGEVNYSLMKFY